MGHQIVWWTVNRLDRFRAWARRDDHADRVCARPAELEELAVIRQSARLRVQQRLPFDAATGIGHFDNDFGLGAPFVALFLVERDKQMLGA